jgi:small-conductance mechanosensitive channel
MDEHPSGLTPVSWGAIVFGGLFLGVWLYLCLWQAPGIRLHLGAWVLYGVVGLALAAGIYGSRVLRSHGARVGLYAAIGVAIGMLATAFVLNQQAEILAALVTFAGAALIVTALPVPPRGGPAPA